MSELSVANLADTIRDRVRQQIVSVIPDEQIDGLIKKEWESFFTPPERDRWSNRQEDSHFQKMVKKEVEKCFEAKIQEAVRKEFELFQQAQWDSNAKVYVREFVKGYTPVVMEAMAANYAQTALSNVLNNMPNNGMTGL